MLELAQSKYSGFNDSHLTEKLVEVEQVAVSRETVRRVLRGAGLASPQKRRVLEELGVEQIAALSPQAKG